ncbi:hypothetical protein NQ314_017014 [Rhamnusium bicolor]|uniref:Uncharacterized protein n=1 Tax=Rhamnusium bicolor TaxID=1586634 RepID=A0AAV8WUF9_9CUCU|nr:hypothetical protein NQ314_017014 [Rhamnusium bicolor]
MKNGRSKPGRSSGSVTLVKSKSSTGATYLKPIIKVRSGKEIEEFKRDLTLDDHIISLDELVKR